MRAVGVIAEYNPLHTGHKYQLRRARELAGADYVVVVMSPDFVQRGEPAVFDKYTRTRMALQCGADLVLELPVSYATGSAEYFAQGAVAALAGTGVVDSICFGAELMDSAKSGCIVPDGAKAYDAACFGTGKVNPVGVANINPDRAKTSVSACFGAEKSNSAGAAEIFLAAARLLNNETKEFQAALRAYLRGGAAFPQARARALAETGHEETAALLSSPNNILGVEYCRAILKLHADIRPLPLKREGASYDCLKLSGSYCSATALRAQIRLVQRSVVSLRRGNPDPAKDRPALLQPCSTEDSAGDAIYNPDSAANRSALLLSYRSEEDFAGDAMNEPDPAEDRSALRAWGGSPGAMRPYIPRDCLPLFYQACQTAVFPDSLLPALRYRLLTPDSFDDIFGLSPELAARLCSMRFSCMDKSFSEVTELLKTRQITETAVRRALLHLVLGIRASETEEARAAGITHYARILGFCKKASPLLHAIRKNGALPLISRTSAADRMLTDTGRRLWKRDLFASHYYASLRGGAFRTEYEHSPIVL